MKKTVAALLIGATLIPAAVIAGGHFGQHRFERMSEQLQLSEQQQTEVQKILEEERQQHRDLRDKSRERISAVLNDEQRAKLEQLREQRGKRFCDRDHDGEKHRQGDGHGPRYEG